MGWLRLAQFWALPVARFISFSRHLHNLEVVELTVALVGHAEVEGVRPDGHTAERSSDGSVVDEELIGHHVELFVTADAQVRSAHADDGAVGDVGETFDDQTVSGHLSQPVVVGAVGPVLGAVLVGDGEGGDLVTAAVEVLNGRVVAVLVRREESTCRHKTE